MSPQPSQERASSSATRRERAAALQAKQRRTERNRNLGMVVAVVIVVALLFAGVFWYTKSSGDSSTTTTNAGGAPARAGDHSLVVGKASAPTKVVVYEDFLCPYCRQFEMASRDYLHRDAKAGKVQVEYRPFHLLPDQYSTDALNVWAAVLERGTPAQALKFHDALYDSQPYEQAQNKPDSSALVQEAGKAGVDTGKIRARALTPDQSWVDAADAAARKAGVKGTPTVFVDGKPLQGTSIGAMADNLQRRINAAGSTKSSTKK